MKRRFARIVGLIGLSLLAASGALFAQQAQPRRPDLDPEEIIRRFAEAESQFRKVWETYTYQQEIVFQEFGYDDEVVGQRVMKVEVYFTNDGRRHTRKISDTGRLKTVKVTKEDISDAIALQPFVLTTEELPKYEVKYERKLRVDEIDTFVFQVEPRRIEKGERYFKGRIFVDDLDYQIVMTQGKIVPDDRRNKFPKFETVREQIDGQYWFPTWTEADDVLTFGDFMSGGRSVRVRQLVTFSDFKRFEVGTSIEYEPVPE